MAEHTQTEAPPLNGIFETLPSKDQKMILDAFNLAVGLAERAGLLDEEIFQLFEDVIDGRDIEEARAEMQRTGEKPKSLEEVKAELGF